MVSPSNHDGLSSQGDEPDLPPEYQALIKKVWDGLVTAGDIDKDTAVHTANTLMEGVYKGYGKDFASVVYNSPDYEMLAALEQNVFQFSAAKNYHMIKDLTLGLKDGDNIRYKYTDYRREALKKVDTWNNNWGKTEYNTGIASAQSIANWARFEKNKHIMPILKFVAVHDEKECPICKAYDGLIRHMDDPIWNRANVPLHFGDRCNVIQLADPDADQTPDDQLPPADLIPEMFRVNQYKERLAFPEGSAYFKDLPKEILHKDITIQRAIVRDWAKTNLGGKTYPSAIGDVVISKKNLHTAIGKGHDFEFEKNTAIYKLRELLKQGKHVHTANDVEDSNVKWHYLQVRIAGEKSYLNVKEDISMGKMYFHAITDKLKK